MSESEKPARGRALQVALCLAGALAVAGGTAWWVHPGAGLIAFGAALLLLGWPT